MNTEITDSQDSTKRATRHWEFVIPWFLTTISTVVLFGVAWFLLENLLWLREEALTNYDNSNLSYRSHTYFLYVSSIRRSAGLFSGIALMFLGIGVSFYTLKSQTNLKMGSGENLTFGIVTASPGIIAMVLGVFLIVHNTSSKDKIPIFEEQQQKTEMRASPPP